jgi:hypothetical protein
VITNVRERQRLDAISVDKCLKYDEILGKALAISKYACLIGNEVKAK